MNLQAYSPILLGIVYVSLREKFFPKYTGSKFNPDDFIDLGKLLQKEGVHPQRYMEFIFGILNTTKPTGPKGLADPVLIAKYRNMTGDLS